MWLDRTIMAGVEKYNWRRKYSWRERLYLERKNVVREEEYGWRKRI